VSRFEKCKLGLMHPRLNPDLIVASSAYVSANCIAIAPKTIGAMAMLNNSETYRVQGNISLSLLACVERRF
jgi:hypothetical protein